MGNNAEDGKLSIVNAKGKRLSLDRKQLKLNLTKVIGSEKAEQVLKLLEEGCFTGETLVTTKDGLKRIDEIKEGDYVLSKDVNAGAVDYKEVKQVYIKSTDKIVHLNIDGEEIRTTKSHLFFTDSGWWKAVENIQKGDKIVDSIGIMKEVQSVYVEKLAEYERIYNLNVEDYHTYFVGT